MEYQIVSLIDICQFNLTPLILIGQQLHVHVKLLSDDYGTLLVLFPDVVTLWVRVVNVQFQEISIPSPRKLNRNSKGEGVYVNVKPSVCMMC